MVLFFYFTTRMHIWQPFQKISILICNSSAFGFLLQASSHAKSLRENHFVKITS